jgi:hypothetical protein
MPRAFFFIGLGSSKLGQKWSLRQALPDGSLGRPDGQLFLVRKVILEFLQGRPDARCFRLDGGHLDLLAVWMLNL